LVTTWGTTGEGFSYFVTSIAAPVAAGWSGCWVGLAPPLESAALSRRTRRADIEHSRSLLSQNALGRSHDLNEAKKAQRQGGRLGDASLPLRVNRRQF